MKWTWQSMKPGNTTAPAQSTAVVAVQAGADVDDPPVLDGHVAGGDLGAGGVEDPAALEDRAHGSNLARSPARLVESGP